MKNLAYLLFFIPFWLSAQPTPPVGGTATVTVDRNTSELRYPLDFFEVNAGLVQQPIIDVVDNAAKLALTGIHAGQRVRVTGEGDRIEMYLGPGEEATGSVVLHVPGVPELDGLVVPESGEYFGRPAYVASVPGPLVAVYIEWDGLVSQWIITTDDGSFSWLSNDDVATPDLVTTWDIPYGVTPLDSVTAETVPTGPETDANWVTLFASGRKYPVFEIQVPPSSGFTDFELKASVTNFDGNVVYYYHSPDPQLAQSVYDELPLVWFTRSGPGTIVHRQQPDNASIASTLPDVDSEVGSIFVLVRGDESWMWEGNPEVLWAFVFFDPIGPEEDQDGNQIWRAVQPVRWLTESQIPAFLSQ